MNVMRNLRQGPLLALLPLMLAGCGSGESRDEPAVSEVSEPAADVAAAGDETEAPADKVVEGATDEPVSAEQAVPEVAAMQPPPAFAQCRSCHSVEPGRQMVGPSLAGIFGTKAGDVPGYNFSAAMKESDLVWDEATLDKYLQAPREVVPGTKMIFPGLKDEAKRQAVITYLKAI